MAIVLADDNEYIPDEVVLSIPMMTAAEVAEKMHTTVQAVYYREAFDFISVLPPGRQRGRMFPEFVIHPAMNRELMHQLKLMFRGAGASNDVLLRFLVHPPAWLCPGWTPLEVLLRKANGDVKKAAKDFLASDWTKR